MSLLHSWLWKQNGGQCDWAYGNVRELGGPVIPGGKTYINIFCHLKLEIALEIPASNDENRNKQFNKIGVKITDVDHNDIAAISSALV